MTTTPQPLWDDARIATLAEYAAANWDAAHAGDLLRRMRDQYEAELAAARARVAVMEAELAARGEWEPVEEEFRGERHGVIHIPEFKGIVYMIVYDNDPSDPGYLTLPDDWRICRRVAEDAP